MSTPVAASICSVMATSDAGNWLMRPGIPPREPPSPLPSPLPPPPPVSTTATRSMLTFCTVATILSIRSGSMLSTSTS